MKYAAESLKLDHILLDSLMKCGIAHDDYTGQARFVNELCAIAKGTGSHISLVAHMKKPQGHDTSKMPDRYSIAGHSDISNQAHNVLIVWNDDKKKKEANKPEHLRDKKVMDKADMVFTVEKQRNGEFEGGLGLWFDERSLQFKDLSLGKTKDYTQHM